MTQPFGNVLGYQRMVAEMLQAFPEDEAMSRAVGGNYEYFGRLERLALEHLGLFGNARVLDVGCGSGRLAAHLAGFPELFYHGTDIVPALLDYARRRAGRGEFHFTLAAGFRLPHAEGTMDFVCFFSVMTHLLHEESYAYLAEALRVLRPGGKVLVSFFDPCLDGHWHVFEENVQAARQGSPRGHLNVFIHPEQLRLWAARLGGELVRIIPGNEAFIEVSAAAATDAVREGRYALGQSLAVITRPEDPAARLPEGPLTGFIEASPTPRDLFGWARMDGRPDVPLRIELRQGGRLVGQGNTGLPREGLGPCGFHLTLDEPLDEDALLAGEVEVTARHGQGLATRLQVFDGLRQTLRHRRALRLLRELSPEERAAVLGEAGAS